MAEPIRTHTDILQTLDLSQEDLDTISGLDVSHIAVLASSRAVIGDTVSAATIVTSSQSGKIINIFSRIIPATAFPPGTIYTDYSPCVLLPGLVDAHVHLNVRFVP